MARIQQDTVQYFPHDTAASDGDTMTIIEANFGNDGYAFWFKLLEKLGRTPGHSIDCNNPIKMDLLSAKSHITTNKAITILEMLSQLGAIDKELWQNKVIWSQHFVDNVQDVYTNRKRTAPSKPVITSSNPITNSSNSKNTLDEKITTSKSTQSRVNETILNETKGKEEGITAATLKDIFYSFKEDAKYDAIDFENEYQKFCDYYGNKKLTHGKANCHNWLDKALEYRANSPGNNGHKTHTAQTGGDPDKFTNPESKWGAVVAQRTADAMAARESTKVKGVVIHE